MVQLGLVLNQAGSTMILNASLLPGKGKKVGTIPSQEEEVGNAVPTLADRKGVFYAGQLPLTSSDTFGAYHN